MRSLILLVIAFTAGFTSVVATTDKKNSKKYNEVYRPQFHFTPEKGIIGNPSGLVFYGDEYHLFYQYNPDTTATAMMQWGHSVSKDLIRWEHLSPFTVPDGQTEGRCTPHTGSAVVDVNNLSGLQEGSEKTILLYYTGRECGQNLAYSNDKGRTWKIYGKNPLLPHSDDGANGPKIFFDSSSGNWIMTLFRKPDGDATKQGISFYSSKDLLKWEFQSHLPGFSNTADLFRLAVEGKSSWILSGANNEYLVGSFDGKTFTPDTKTKRIDFGRNFQAAQVCTNHPDEKIIQIAWMRGGNYPKMPFNGQMSFPCELSLKNSAAGPLLCRKPIETISSLYDKDLNKKEKNLIPGIKGNLVGGIKGEMIHIKAKLDPKTSDSFGFIIRNGKNSAGTYLKYESAKKMLDCLSRQVLVEPKNGKLDLEILVDRTSIEIFANGGEAVLSSCFNPTEGDNDLILWTQGGELFVDEVQVYTLKSIWENQMSER